MKTELKPLDFETWHSWNMPSYIKIQSEIPNYSIGTYIKKKRNTNSWLVTLCIFLLVTLVVSHWEKVVRILNKLQTDLNSQETKHIKGNDALIDYGDL